MGIKSFRDKASADICDGVTSGASRRALPIELHERARIKLARLAAATDLNDLAELRGNHFEKLKGDRSGQYSIRINNQYRICFEWQSGDAYNVEIVDYH